MVLIAFIACSFMPVFAGGNAGDREHGKKGRAPILEDDNDNSPAPDKAPDKVTPVPAKTESTPDAVKETPEDTDDSGAPTPVKTVITPKPVSPGNSSTPMKPVPTQVKPASTPVKPVPSPSKTTAAPVKPVPSPETTVPAPVSTPEAVKKTPVYKAPAENVPYKGSHWDYFAKTVRFTVYQELQLKTLLQKEREDILKLRQNAEFRVFEILDPKQKQKWESEKSSSKKMGADGFYKRQALINPLFLKTFIKINNVQHSKIHNIFWEYTRKVGKIRRSNQEKIEKILMPEQLVKWEAATRHRR
jgi:hypothetical protein